VDLSGILNLEYENFDLNTTFRNVMPGPLLNVESLGAFSGSAAFSGSGFNLDSLSAKGSLEFDSLSYKNHTYINTSITAKLLYGFYEFNLIVDDPGLKTGLFTTLNRSDSTFILNANATLFAQLDELHLTEDTVSVESTFTAGFSRKSEAIESEISLQNIKFVSPLDQTNIHQLNAYFFTDSSESHLKAESDFFETDILIGEPLEKFDLLMENYRNYLSTFVDSSHSIADTRIAQLPTTDIKGSIIYHEGLGMVLQDTGIRFTNLDFSLTNSISDKSLNYAVTGKDLKYKNIEIGELKATAIDSAGTMDVHLLANKNILFNNPAHDILLNGHFSDWQGDAEFSVIDDTGTLFYNLNLTMDLRAVCLHLQPGVYLFII